MRDSCGGEGTAMTSRQIKSSYQSLLSVVGGDNDSDTRRGEESRRQGCKMEIKKKKQA